MTVIASNLANDTDTYTITGVSYNSSMLSVQSWTVWTENSAGQTKMLDTLVIDPADPNSVDVYADTVEALGIDPNLPPLEVAKALVGLEFTGNLRYNAVEVVVNAEG